MTSAESHAAASAGSPGSARYLVLIGAIVVQLILGTVYGYSIFWQPLHAEVFPEVVPRERIVTRDQAVDRVITVEANAERIEAGDALPHAIVVADEQAAERRRAAIGEGEPVDGYMILESEKAVEQVKARIDAGQSIEGFSVVDSVEAMKERNAEQQGLLKYAFSICILSFALTMVIAGRVQDIKGPRLPAIIGAVLMGLGFLLAGLMTSPIVFYLAHAAFAGGLVLVLLMLFDALFGKVDSQQAPIIHYVPYAIVTGVAVGAVVLGVKLVGELGPLDHLFLLWGTVGFLAGAGIGFAYVCPIAALVKWFPEHKGLVSGLAVAGFGFGAYLFKGQTFGALGYIEAHGITAFFLVHGVICLIVVTLGAMLLRNPPAATSQASAGTTADSTWQDTLRRPAFYVIWLMFFSGAMAGLMVIGIIKPFAQAQAEEGGLGIAQAATVGAAAVGWLAIFNALGRIVWGLVSDRIGRTPAFVVMFSFQAVVLFVLGSLTGEVALYIAAALVGFNFGGNFALFPSATADLFGAKNMGANYGWVFTSYGIAGVVGIAAGNYALTETGSYTAAFIVAAVLCLISAILAVGLAMTQKRAVT